MRVSKRYDYDITEAAKTDVNANTHSIGIESERLRIKDKKKRRRNQGITAEEKGFTRYMSCASPSKALHDTRTIKSEVEHFKTDGVTRGLLQKDLDLKINTTVR